MSKKITTALTLTLTLTLTLLLTGCKKYEEGPRLSFRSVKNRVYGFWHIEKYYVDGVDSTENYRIIIGCDVSFAKNDYQSWCNFFSLHNCNSDSVSYIGNMLFIGNQKKRIIKLIFSGVHETYDTITGKSVHPFGLDTTAEWEIKKLRNMEMNLETTLRNKSYRVELSLIRN